MNGNKKWPNITPEILNHHVFCITGEDVVSILDQRGELRNLTHLQVAQLVDYIERKIYIEWAEAIEGTLDSLGCQAIIKDATRENRGVHNRSNSVRNGDLVR